MHVEESSEAGEVIRKPDLRRATEVIRSEEKKAEEIPRHSLQLSERRLQRTVSVSFLR